MYLKIKEATSKGYAEAYEGDGVNLGVPNSKTRRGRVQNGGVNTLTTQSEMGVVVYDEQNKKIHENADTVNTIMADGSSPKKNARVGVMESEANNDRECTRKILQALRDKVGDGAFAEWVQKIIVGIKENDLLQQRVHEKKLPTDGQPKEQDEKECTQHIETDKRVDTKAKRVPTLWLCEELRCTSQRWGLDEQYHGELDSALQELSHERTQAKIFLHSLWETCQGLGVLQQALHPLQEVWQSADVLPQSRLRIRKLTEVECWRLQGWGFQREDGSWDDTAIQKAKAAGVSATQLYKQAGNGCSANVVEAIGLRLKEVEGASK